MIRASDEAWFCVGLLNSRAMTEAINPFNPKGSFGPRHIHALPYLLLPAFEPANNDHVHIAALAREAVAIAQDAVAEDDYLHDPSHVLHVRRTRLREKLFANEQVQELELLCATMLGAIPPERA